MNTRTVLLGIAVLVTSTMLPNPERTLLGLKAGTPEDPKPAVKPELKVKPTEDFEVTGDGRAEAWKKAEWEPLHRREAKGLDYQARVKLLYSKKGLYVLMNGTDRKLTATLKNDFDHLWMEDVFEAFLWPDERDPLYFEYEISPLGRELPILVPNLEGKYLGWRPWLYDGDRKVRKAVSGVGGKGSGAAVQGWTAEFFIPYGLLRPLRNVPPKPGTRWRANFYRMDYDGGNKTSWDWARVGGDFHEFQKFGTLVFE